MVCLYWCSSLRTLMKEILICSNGSFPLSASKSCYKYVPTSIFISANPNPGAARRLPTVTGSAGSGHKETCLSFWEANPKVAVGRGSPCFLCTRQHSGFVFEGRICGKSRSTTALSRACKWFLIGNITTLKYGRQGVN